MNSLLQPLDELYGALFRPRATFLTGAPTTRAAALTVLVVATVWSFGLAQGQATLLPIAFVATVGSLVTGWLAAAVALYLVVRALYQRGELARLFASIGLSLAPLMLVGPLDVLGRFGDTGLRLQIVGALLLSLWWLRLLLLAIRGAADLNGGQAVWSLVAAELVAVALPTLWVLLSGIMLVLALGTLV